MEMNELVSDVVKELFDHQVEVVLTRPEPEFGDYATNVALQLAKPLGRNPREVADEIAKKLRESGEFEEVSVAGPGFVNLRLTDEALLQLIERKPAKTLTGKKVLVEYSDPNPLKPLHAGHLYATLVGDIIASLVENAGAETIRLNYGGDVGLHTARSMWAIVQHFDRDEDAALSGIEAMASDDLHERASFLGKQYAVGTEASETDEVKHKEIIEYNKRVYAIHSQNDHESSFAKLYWTVRQWSYDYFQILYKELQVHEFDRFIPESEVTPLGLQTVREQLENGVYEKSAESDAIIFDGEKFGLHTRVFINSEGLPTYEAKDVGLSLTKWNDYHFDESIITTAAEQAQYMQVVIKSIEQFAPEPAQRTNHITHGMVKLRGGVKMSSRKGNIVSALQILEAAREAGKESGFETSEETILAAVKYAFAKVRIGGDIDYDPKESIALDGNSGPYLQYAHARACGIEAKATQEMKKPEMLTESERSLTRKLGEAVDVIEKATLELHPHLICTYLYELAQEFNRFYESSRIVGDEREAERLYLLMVYRMTLQYGLSLLGIAAPEKI